MYGSKGETLVDKTTFSISERNYMKKKMNKEKIKKDKRNRFNKNKYKYHIPKSSMEKITKHPENHTGWKVYTQLMTSNKIKIQTSYLSVPQKTSDFFPSI